MWTEIELSSQDDVTVSQMFCTNGVFKIRSGEPVLNYPEVKASVQNDRMLVAIDKNVSLLAEEECHLMNYDFNIDSISTSNSGQIVLCGLGNGHVHGSFINGIPVFDLVIQEEDVREEGRTFIGIQELNKNYYVVCSSGALYLIENLNDELNVTLQNSEGQNDGTLVYDETILSSVDISLAFRPAIPNLHLSCSTVFNSVNLNGESILSGIYCDDHFLYVFSKSPGIKTDMDKIRLPKSCPKVKKIFNLENYIILLAENGQIYEFCPDTKLIEKRRNLIEIEDISVLENNFVDCIELMLLTKPNKSGKKVMKIVDFPTMKSNYELVISEHCWLVNQPKNALNMYYLYGGVSSLNGNLPDEIEMKKISELHPNQRFKKLISRGLFEEAEQFAKEFNLSLEPIYKHRVQTILRRISEERNLERLSEIFLELHETISKLEMELDFLADLIRVDIPSRSLKKEFLIFLNNKFIQQNYDKRNVLSDIEEQLRRLDTLHLIDPYECNLDWQNFIDEQNLIKHCTKLMATKIQVASIIWSRHASLIVPYLTAFELNKIFSSIPQDTEFIDILHWLRHISPGLIQVHPEFMEMLVDWSLKKTKTLEMSSLWPANGLQFVKNLHEIFKGYHFLVIDPKRQIVENINKISNFVNILEELAELKGEYNLSIRLDHYLNADLEKKALNLLQRVQINNLQKLISNFIFPLFIKYNQSPKNAMINYVQFLIANRKFTSLWQQKAVMVIQQLPNEDDRLSCAFQILNVAPVPWIEELKPLVAYGYTSHPLAGEILSKFELQIVKMIKVKYNYPIAENGNPMQLIYRIVKVGNQDMVQDLQALIKAMPSLSKRIYCYCIMHFIKKDMMENALIFFDEFNKEKSDLLIQMFVTSFQSATVKEMQSVMEFLKIVITRTINEDTKEIISALDSVYKFQMEFDITVPSINDLKLKSEELLDKGIDSALKKLMADSSAADDLIKHCFDHLSNLSRLLNLDIVKCAIRICEKVGRLEFTWALVNILLDSIEIDSENCDHFIELGILILTQELNALIGVEECSNANLPVYPLVYRIFCGCISRAKLHLISLKDLLSLIRIGSNLYSNEDWKEFHCNNDMNSVISKILSPENGFNETKSRRRSAKRDSFSIFDQSIVIDEDKKTVSKSHDSDSSLDLIIKTLGLVMQIMIKLDQGTIYQAFLKFIRPDFQDIDYEELTQSFFETINQMYQSEKLEELHLIFDEVNRLQKRLNLKILNANHIISLNKKLLKFRLSKTDVDIKGCFLILIKNSPNEILSGLESEMKTIIQKANFCSLAELYSFSTGRLEDVANLKARRIKYKYFAQISKTNPNLKLDFESFNANALPYLKMDVKTLERMCHEFGCSYQDVLMSQVVQVLRGQELRFEVQRDEMGVEKIRVLTLVEEIMNLCIPLVNEIQMEMVHLFTKMLLKFTEQVDSYFYEMYLVVIEILTMMNSVPSAMDKWKDILQFLRHKMVLRRRVRPSQAEFDWWLKTQCEMTTSGLPKIAKFRFPFLRLIQNIQETLVPEINIENCVSWFPFITSHALMRGLNTMEEIDKEVEVLCSKAVKNSVADWKAQIEDKRNDVWHLIPQNNAFLQSILRLVEHMGSESKIFSILYFTMNQMSEGADQVDAAQACYKYGMENMEAIMKDDYASEALKKIKRKYPFLKTQHLLHVYGFAEDSLMNLIEKPFDLITALYMHHSILKDLKPNITGLVTEIADLHNLPLNSIQKMLVKQFLHLQSNNKLTTSVPDESVMIVEDALEESAVEQIVNKDGHLTNFEATTRAYFIINSWSKEMSFAFLLPQLHSMDLDQMNNPTLLNNYLLLYECLSHYLSDSESRSICDDILNQDDYLTFKILFLLHKIKYRFDKSQPSPLLLESADKIALLKSLWQGFSGSEKGIEVMALICLKYSINVKNIWNGIIKKMISLKMQTQLKSVVDLVTTRRDLLIIESLPLAYQYVLREPLKNGTKEKSSAQEAKLCSTLLLLENCPVTSKLNLLELAEMFLNLDRPYMAAVLLPYVTDEKVKQQILELLGPHKNEQLKRDIDQLIEFGLLSLITKSAIRQLFQDTEEQD